MDLYAVVDKDKDETMRAFRVVGWAEVEHDNRDLIDRFWVPLVLDFSYARIAKRATVVEAESPDAAVQIIRDRLAQHEAASAEHDQLKGVLQTAGLTARVASRFAWAGIDLDRIDSLTEAEVLKIRDLGHRSWDEVAALQSRRKGNP